MTAKQYLRQAYRLNELINSHTKELESLKLLLTSLPGIDFSQEKVQGGKLPCDRTPNIISQIVELENEVKQEIENFITLKKEVHDVINAVTNPNEKLVLRYRYIEFLTWEQTANLMAYSIKQVHRIHSEALLNVIVPET
jgi:DNA-directed RNA polymerase specialized sigma subunit